MSKSVIAFLLSFVTLSIPLTSLAESIGISPGRVERTIFQGDKIRETVYLSRSGRDGEVLFDVSSSNPFIAECGGQTTAIIPDGESMAPFCFVIDASNLEIGDYEETITFVLAATAEEEAAGGTTIAFGLANKILAHVRPRPESWVVLSAEEYPPALGALRVGNLSATEKSAVGGHNVRLTWSVNNDGPNPVTNVPTSVSMTRDGVQVYTKWLVSREKIWESSAGLISYDFFFPEGPDSGTYGVSVEIGKTKSDSRIFILRNLTKWILLGISAACLLAFAAAGTVATRRFLARRHH